MFNRFRRARAEKAAVRLGEVRTNPTRTHAHRCEDGSMVTLTETECLFLTRLGEVILPGEAYGTAELVHRLGVGQNTDTSFRGFKRFVSRPVTETVTPFDDGWAELDDPVEVVAARFALHYMRYTRED